LSATHGAGGGLGGGLGGKGGKDVTTPTPPLGLPKPSPLVPVPPPLPPRMRTGQAKRPGTPTLVLYASGMANSASA
jgi:hypothetical protein